MRKMILCALTAMGCLFMVISNASPVTDSTAKISHVLDGNISEWQIEKFETDKDTHVQYGVDHDAANLYMAVKINDPRLQMKLMVQGMFMYIDKKGKKREGTGIAFPVKRAGGGFQGGGGRSRDGEGGGQRPDPKEMREQLASTMVFLKTFGFENQDQEKTQLIVVPGGISVAFDWNEANEMFIEYQVPLAMIGEPASLHTKPIGIGWKIGAVSTLDQFSRPEPTSPSRPGGNTGGGRGGRGGGGSPDFGSAGADSRAQEQSIWTKYTINF